MFEYRAILIQRITAKKVKHGNNSQLKETNKVRHTIEWGSSKDYSCKVWAVVFNATFNNVSVILWQSVFLVEETGVPGENHRPVTSH